MMTKLALALLVAALLVCSAFGGRHAKHLARRHPNPTRSLLLEQHPSTQGHPKDEPSSLPGLTNDKILSDIENLCPDEEAIAPCDCTFSIQQGHQGDVWLECVGITQAQLENVFQQEFPEKDLYQFTIQDSFVTSLDFDLNGITFEDLRVEDTPITLISEDFLTNSSSRLYGIELLGTRLTVEGFPFAALENMEVLGDLVFNGANVEYLPTIVSPSLKYLWFRDTPIPTISPGIFDGMPLLINIQFIETNVTELEAGTFPIKDNTKTVKFSGLESLVPGAFYPDSDNSSIEMYNVYDGTLTELLPDTFPIGWDTIIMDFSNNRLETIHAGAIYIISPPWENTIDFNLNGNQLTEVNEEVFGPLMPYVSTLNLEDNPLTCGCDIAWIILDEENMAKIDHHSTCADGRAVIDLDPEYYEDQC